MTNLDLDKRIENIETGIEKLKDKKSGHGWLYLMAFTTMLMTGVINDQTQEVKNQIENLFQKIKNKNVIGEKAPDKFYEINGQRAYLEIDGKPIADYFKSGEEIK